MKLKNLLLLILLTFYFSSCKSQTNIDKIIVGAEQAETYLPKLKNKNVGLMVNQSSLVDTVHLLDFLISNKINVQKIFAVEHGFRGNAANGEEFNSSIDEKTQLPIISLYGNNKKANPDQLIGIDVVVFDLQDVGCRFFTYISSMHYMMEACAENDIEFIVLDRPNPNGDYIDGPVLDLNLKSFVGMHPIPVVHGCTVGELAMMINNEGWLQNGLRCKLEVIPVKNYSHSDLYILPIKPSPNLPNHTAVRLYPSLCFFEATNVSIGRGTHFPFQVIGFPECSLGDFTFTPVSITGMSNNPIYENIECRGIDLRKEKIIPKFTLNYLIQFMNEFTNQEDFWKSKRWIELLSGDANFHQQLNDGWDEAKIRASWKTEIDKYKEMRKKYLLYTDFE